MRPLVSLHRGGPFSETDYLIPPVKVGLKTLTQGVIYGQGIYPSTCQMDSDYDKYYELGIFTKEPTNFTINSIDMDYFVASLTIDEPVLTNIGRINTTVSITLGDKCLKKAIFMDVFDSSQD
jgi:hypothetical protein